MTGPENAGYVDPTEECFSMFKELDHCGPIHMLNLLKFREKAAYDDGTVATGGEAYQNYSRESGQVFSKFGGWQVWLGTPELALIGPGEETWDLAFIDEYPSKDSFVAMLSDPDYNNALRHRQAAVLDSRLIVMNPSGPDDLFLESTNSHKENQDMTKQPRPLNASELVSLRQDAKKTINSMRAKLSQLKT